MRENQLRNPEPWMESSLESTSNVSSLNFEQIPPKHRRQRQKRGSESLVFRLKVLLLRGRRLAYE